jgi:DNA-binding NtrC family response regulator
MRWHQGGTLFLDEITEMPASMQVKLLQSHPGKKASSSAPTSQSVDVRFIAATNRDIQSAIKPEISGRTSVSD